MIWIFQKKFHWTISFLGAQFLLLTYSQNTMISLENVDFWSKIYLILHPSFGNLTTHIAIPFNNSLWHHCSSQADHAVPIGSMPIRACIGLQDIPTLDFNPNLQPRTSQPQTFQPWTLQLQTPIGLKNSGWKVRGWNICNILVSGLFNPRLFNHEIFDPIGVWGWGVHGLRVWGWDV